MKDELLNRLEAFANPFSILNSTMRKPVWVNQVALIFGDRVVETAATAPPTILLRAGALRRPHPAATGQPEAWACEEL